MGYTSFLYSGLLILSELVIFRNLLPGTTYQVWVFSLFISVPNFGLVCRHGNSFLSLE